MMGKYKILNKNWINITDFSFASISNMTPYGTAFRDYCVKMQYKLICIYICGVG